MCALKYYSDEESRLDTLSVAAGIGDAIDVCAFVFSMLPGRRPLVVLLNASGNRHLASDGHVWMCRGFTWTDLAHELAHVADFRVRKSARRRHDSQHKLMTDLIAHAIARYLNEKHPTAESNKDAQTAPGLPVLLRIDRKRQGDNRRGRGNVRLGQKKRIRRAGRF